MTSPLDLTDAECDAIIERLTRTIPSGRERRRKRHEDEDPDEDANATNADDADDADATAGV